MHNPQTPLSVKGYQDMLLKDAQGPHWVRVTKARSQRPWEPVLASVGEFLIELGSRLRERYTQPLPSGCEVCSTAAGKASV